MTGTDRTPDRNTPISGSRLEALLNRTAGILREEIDTLKTNDLGSIRDVILRKERCFYELTIAMMQPGAKQALSERPELLDSLHRTISDNASALSSQVSAVKGVVDLLADAEREAESDGTYRHGYGVV